MSPRNDYQADHAIGATVPDFTDQVDLRSLPEKLTVLDYYRVCSSAQSRLCFLRLRLRAKADLRRFFWPGFR